MLKKRKTKSMQWASWIGERSSESADATEQLAIEIPVVEDVTYAVAFEGDPQVDVDAEIEGAAEADAEMDIIRTANVIGILKAAKLPDISPGDKEFPTINKTPVIARIIDTNVKDVIVSFKNKYPNIARNNICVEMIKLVFATVVLYIAKTYPQKPKDKIIPPKNPGNPES